MKFKGTVMELKVSATDIAITLASLPTKDDANPCRSDDGNGSFDTYDMTFYVKDTPANRKRYDLGATVTVSID